MLIAGVFTTACSGGGGGSGGGDAGAVATEGCGAPANQAWDSDHDGIPDSVCVSDFDRDGALEIDDVEDALTSVAAAPKRFVTVLPGAYRAPANPAARPGRTHGLLELPSDTTLSCQAGAALRGSQSVATSSDYAVIANADHVAGNRNITISGCEIDGGAPGAFTDAGSYTIRMGVFLRRTTDSLVENNFVHHTYHSGLYTSNSVRDVFRNNRIEDAGGYGNVGPWAARFRYPCIYAYSFGGGSVVDFVAENNDMHRCAADGLNTRAEDTDAPGDVIRNVRFSGNRVEDTGNSTDDGPIYRATGSTCMTLRGVDGAMITDNTCVSAGAIYLYPASSYRSQGNDNANRGVVIQRQLVQNADAIAGVWIGPYVDGLAVSDVTVRGTRDDAGRAMDWSCFVINPPLRGATFEGLDLSDCGRIGFEEANQGGSGATPEESIAIRDLLIDGADLFTPLDSITQPGMRFSGPHAGLLIEGATIRGTTGPGILFAQRLQHVVLRNLWVDGVETGWLGSFAEANAPACDAARENHWITTANASAATDCDFTSGTGSAHARCGCAGGAWSSLAPRPHAGIELDASSPASLDVRIEQTMVANERDDTGVRIFGDFSGFAASSLVGADTSAATDEDQNSAIEIPSSSSGITLSAISCTGTDPMVSCVQYESP
jgi:hypothetical protein